MKQNDVRSYDLFVAVLAVLVLPILAYRFTLEDGSEEAKLIDWLDLGVCAVFLHDFVRTLVRSENRRKYLLTWGVFDLASSIPLVHGLRWLRIARLIRVLRAVKSVSLLVRSIRNEPRAAVAAAAMGVTTAALTLSSIGILRIEMSLPQSNIHTAEDALWWSLVTISTVGYGDHFPVTIAGKIIAVLLMICGIGLFASFAGILADSVRATARLDPQFSGQMAHDVDLRLEIRELKNQISDLNDSVAALVNRLPP